MTLIEKIADFSVNLKFEQLPGEVVHEIKRTLIDCIGCAIGGINIEKGKIAIEWAKLTSTYGEATVLGTGDKVSPLTACIVNGELMHALDYEALLAPPAHVSPYVIPTTLALAEKVNSSGKEIITALAIAHEISTRLGRALSYIRDIKDGKIVWPQISGFSCSVFGGALAASKILGLELERTAHALGIAGHIAPVQTTTKFLLTPPLASTKHLMSGWLNAAGFIAATFAELGYRGDVEVLEGDFGFWRFVGSDKWKPEVITDKLGVNWLIPGNTFYKPYPCGGVLGTALDSFIYIIDENELLPHEINRVTIYIDNIIAPDTFVAPLPAFTNRKIVTAMDAQMSGAYITAVAAHRVPIGPDWQSLDTMNNADIRSFMDRVSVEVHPRYVEVLVKEPNARIGGAKVEARGKIFSEERKYRKGSPISEETKMTDEELLDKFKRNTTRILPSKKIDKASSQLMELEEIESWNTIMDNLII